jgi:nucleoside-diphosphate-sugar epimerase
MKVIITGATGMIGESNPCRDFDKRLWKVRKKFLKKSLTKPQ